MDTPLQLDDYFFPHVKVSADPNAFESGDASEGALSLRVTTTKADDEETFYQVGLHISVTPESEEKRCKYSVELVAVGFFQVHPEFDNPVKLLEVNGASILYSAAREFIITTTSRGPWGAITLPVFSFLKQYEDALDARQKESGSDSEK